MRGGITFRCSFLSFWMPCRAMSTSTSVLKKAPVAAIAQLRSTSNKYQNLLDIARCARMATSQGASMLFLPECFGFMSESSAQTLDRAEDPVLEDSNSNDDSVTKALISAITDPDDDFKSTVDDEKRVYLLDGLKTIAREADLWISGGGMHVSRAPEDPESGNQRVYNTHVILDSQGEVKAIYRKIHLFDVFIPGKVQLRESATTAPGTKLVVCDSPVGRLGLSTCYDMRFPEMYAPLVENGAQIILVPSAFTVPTGAAHWHTLLKARAIETQCYVLASAQYGRHNERRESFGHSLAVNPWGKVLADAGGYPCEDYVGSSPADTPTIVTCEIDLSQVDSIRTRMPIVQAVNKVQLQNERS